MANQIIINNQETFVENISQLPENICTLVVSTNNNIVPGNITENQIYSFSSIEQVSQAGIVPVPSSYEQNNIFGTSFTTGSTDTISNSDILNLNIVYDKNIVPPININYDPTQDNTLSPISNFPTGKYLRSIFDETNDTNIVVATDGIYTSDPTQKTYIKQLSYLPSQFLTQANTVIKQTTSSGVFSVNSYFQTSTSPSVVHTGSIFTYNSNLNTISNITNYSGSNLNYLDNGGGVNIIQSGSSYISVTINSSLLGSIISSTGDIDKIEFVPSSTPTPNIANPTIIYDIIQYSSSFYLATNNGIWTLSNIVAGNNTITYVTGGASVLGTANLYSKLHLTGVPNYPIGYLHNYTTIGVSDELWVFNINTSVASKIGSNGTFKGTSVYIKNIHWVKNTTSSGGTEYGYFLSMGVDDSSPVIRITYVTINNTGTIAPTAYDIQSTDFSLSYTNNLVNPIYVDNFIGYDNSEKKILLTNSSGTQVALPEINTSGAPFIKPFTVSNFKTLFQDLVNQMNNDTRLSGNFTATYDGGTPSFSITTKTLGRQFVNLSWNKISISGVVTPIFTSTPIVPSYIQTNFNKDLINGFIYEAIYEYFIKAPNTTLYFILHNQSTMNTSDLFNNLKNISYKNRPHSVLYLDGTSTTIAQQITFKNTLDIAINNLQTDNYYVSCLYSSNAIFLDQVLSTKSGLLSYNPSLENNNYILGVYGFDYSLNSPQTNLLFNYDWTLTQLFPFPLTSGPLILGMIGSGLSVGKVIADHQELICNLTTQDPNNSNNVYFNQKIGITWNAISDSNLSISTDYSVNEKSTLSDNSINIPQIYPSGVFLRSDRVEDLKSSSLAYLTNVRVQNKVDRIIYEYFDTQINGSFDSPLNSDGTLGQISANFYQFQLQSILNTQLVGEITPNPVVYLDPKQKPNVTGFLKINVTITLIDINRSFVITTQLKYN